MTENKNFLDRWGTVLGLRFPDDMTDAEKKKIMRERLLSSISGITETDVRTPEKEPSKQNNLL